MRKIRLAALLLVLALFAPLTAALAVNPDEMLSDPALEKRARIISAELRCMVCQNESIDDSNADLARDLRILVRDRLKAGDSDRQVLDFVVERYGEFVLLKPRFNRRTAFLWGFPVGVLLIGGVALAFALRNRRTLKDVPPPLSESEKAELSRLLDGK